MRDAGLVSLARAGDVSVLGGMRLLKITARRVVGYFPLVVHVFLYVLRARLPTTYVATYDYM